MARSFSVNFLINGSENVSRAAAAAKGALASLTSAARNANAKVAAYQRQLANAQAALKQIDAYKNLQRAMNDSIKAQAQIRLANMQTVRQQQQAVKQLDAMRDAYKRLQKFQRGERSALDVDKNSVARLKAALALNEKSMGKGAADVMRAQIRAAEKNIRDREKSLNSIMRGAKSDLAAQDASVKNLSASFAAANAKAQQLQATLAQQRAALAALRTQIPSANIANAEAALRAQINQTTQALNREVDALNRRNAAAQRFSSARQKFSDAYGDFQSAVNFAKDNPLVDATNNAIEFEREMSRVKALTSMRDIRAGNFARVNQNMDDLTALAKHLGATTEFTATQIAQAESYLGMAGWTKEMIMAAVKPIVDVASIVGDGDIPRTADVFSDIMTAANLKPGQMLQVGDKQIEATQHFADAMSYALTQSNMNREDFFQALKYSAPIASTAGLTLGEEVAANMVVASSGIKGSQAGTGMRSGLLTLAGANKKAQAALEEVGESSSDAQKRVAEAQAAFNQLGVTGSNFSQRLRSLGVAFANMSKDDRLNYAYRIFGKTASTFWTKLVSNPESLMDFARYAEEIDTGKAFGWSSDTANVMRDNTWTQLEYVKSAFDAMVKSIGEVFLGATNTGGKGLADMLGKMNEWIKANQTAVQWAGLLAAALTAVVVAGAGLAACAAAVKLIASGLQLLGPVATAAAAVVSAAVNVMKFAFLGMRAVMLGAGPVGWILLLVSLIAVAIYQCDGLRQALSDAWNHPQGAITGFCELMKSSVDSAVQYVVDRWNTLRSALTHPIDAIINFIDHGSVIGGNVQAGEFQRLHGGGGGEFGAVQAQTAVIEAANVQMPEGNVEGMNELMSAAQGAAPELDNVTSAAQPLPPELTNVMNAAQGAAPQVTSVGNAAQGAVGNLNALGSAAGQVAGALAAKAAEISAIHIQVPQVEVIHTQVQAAVASNASGGIYGRGSFLTTFAESSPEAAIPIDRSSRAESLWLQTGNMLSLLDSSSPPVNVTLNIYGQTDDATSIASQVKQTFEDLFDEYLSERRRRSYA